MAAILNTQLMLRGQRGAAQHTGVGAHTPCIGAAEKAKNNFFFLKRTIAHSNGSTSLPEAYTIKNMLLVNSMA